LTGHGTRNDVTSLIVKVDAREVTYGARPPLDARVELGVTPNDSGVTLLAAAAGVPLLEVQAQTGVAGTGLVAALRKRDTDRLLDSELAGQVTIPTTALSEL